MQVLVSTIVGNTVVAIALALLALLAMRLRRPAVAHVLWLLVIIKLLTPPLWRVPVTPPQARTDTTETRVVVERGTGDVAVRVTPPPPTFVPTPATSIEQAPVISTPPPAPTVAKTTTLCVPCILAAAWIIGSLAWAILTAVRIIRFRRVVRDSETAPKDLSAEVARVAARMGIARAPEIRLVDAAVSPMLFFLGRRVHLILPRRLIVDMPRPRRQTVIAHELSHLCRGDHWVRLLEMLALTILWWHPLVWLARRGLREAEEQCCDAWVVALLPGADARRGYADALVDALELVAARAAALPPNATGLGRIQHLRRRITMILTETAPKSVSRAGKIAIAVLAIALIPLSFVRGQVNPNDHAHTPAPTPAQPVPTTATQPAGGDEETRLAVDALLDRAVQDSDDHVRNTALNAIRQFGPRAIPALLDGVKTERTAELSRNLLAGLGPSSLDALLAAVESPDAQVRREALLAIAQILGNSYGSQLHAYGMPGLYGGEMGGAPGGARGGFGGYRPGPAAANVGLTAPGEPFPQQLIPGEMPEPVTRMIPVVTKAARDDDAGVRRAAMQVVGYIMMISAPAGKAEALMPTLLSAMTDADAEVRAMAIGAFQSAGDAAQSATAALTKAVKDENDQVRMSALLALRAIGPSAREATPAVIAALKDPSPPIRAAAAEALGALQAALPPASHAESHAPAEGAGGTPSITPVSAPAQPPSQPQPQPVPVQPPRHDGAGRSSH